MEYTTPEPFQPKKVLFKKSTVIMMLALFLGAVVFWYIYTHSDLIKGETGNPPEKTELQAQNLLDAPDKVGLSYEEYEGEVQRLAIKADTIVLNSACNMEPLIIEISKNGMLTIDNRDSAEHMLVFEDENFFTVTAGSKREINITEAFGKGEGIYRYRCGDQQKTVGIMYVK